MLFYFGFMLLLLAGAMVNMQRAPEYSTLSAVTLYYSLPGCFVVQALCQVSWGGFASVIGAQQNLCLKYASYP